MAKVFESYEVVGNISQKASNETGLSCRVKVIAGGGDQAVASVGTGTVGKGKCNVSLGTSGVVFISAQEFAVDDNNALHAFCHADGKYHFMGVMLSAGASNTWWMNDVLGTKDYVKEQKEITKLGENNTFFLPYLMGERTPHNNPNARGTFIGMTMDTSRADMTQAVLEGVAFALRDSFEIAKSLGVTVERTRINGGGANSQLWCSIVANILNVKVDKINSKEGPAFGAAILAAVGCGKYSSVEEATEKLIKVVDTVEQDPQIVELYNKKYEVFKELYPSLKDMFDKMV
jgi:xylulokinase